MSSAEARCDVLSTDSSRLKVLIGNYTERVTSLSARVAFLESESKNKAYVAVSTLERNKA